MARRQRIKLHDWTPTPLEAIGLMLSASLSAHAPNIPELTDAQLEKVSRDVIKHLRNEADNILSKGD